jgi:hypothetical protein
MPETGTQSNILDNRLMLQMLSGAGANIAGRDSFAAGMNPMIQQNIAAQSMASLQDKRMQQMAKILLGKGMDVTSDKDGKVTVKGDDVKTMTELLGGGSSSLESKGAAQSIYGSPSLESQGAAESIAPSPTSAPQSFNIEEIMSALNPPVVR